MKKDSCRIPCLECPFSRKGPPGGTGGADPTVFIGQAMGPFFLPCHMDPEYERNRRSTRLLQCAGTAIYRSNVGVASLMPHFLLHLPADKEKVFATPAELLAFHRGTSLEIAEESLQKQSPDELLRIELRKIGVQVLHPEEE